VIRQVALQRLNASYQGRAREESYLELAQEHFLDWMRELGLLDEVIFKGGTSLRKFVFGLQSRFSIDLDFATMDRAVGELVIDELESGFTHEGVTFVGFDIGQMLKLVEATFGTVAPPLSAQEEVIVRCSRGDRYRVEQWHEERRAAFYANA
jgi:hypothetical protein